MKRRMFLKFAGAFVGLFIWPKSLFGLLKPKPHDDFRLDPDFSKCEEWRDVGIKVRSDLEALAEHISKTRGLPISPFVDFSKSDDDDYLARMAVFTNPKLRLIMAEYARTPKQSELFRIGEHISLNQPVGDHGGPVMHIKSHDGRPSRCGFWDGKPCHCNKETWHASYFVYVDGVEVCNIYEPDVMRMV